MKIRELFIFDSLLMSFNNLLDQIIYLIKPLHARQKLQTTSLKTVHFSGNFTVPRSIKKTFKYKKMSQSLQFYRVSELVFFSCPDQAQPWMDARLWFRPLKLQPPVSDEGFSEIPGSKLNQATDPRYQGIPVNATQSCPALGETRPDVAGNCGNIDTQFPLSELD